MAYPSDPDKYSVDINLESNENSEGIEFLNIGALNNIPINSIRIIGVKRFYNVSNILHNHNEIVTINNMFIDYRSTQVNTQVDSIVQNYNIRNLTIQNSTGPYIVYEGSFNQNAIGRLTLRPGLTEIQSNAFSADSDSDIRVTIDDQEQPYSIGNYAFDKRRFPRNDDGTSGLSIGKGLRSIGRLVFSSMAYPSDPDKYSVDINLESNENSEGIEFLNIGALNNIPINSIRIIGVVFIMYLIYYITIMKL